jgi:hypothetical protein
MSLNSKRQDVKKAIFWSVPLIQNLRRKFKGLNIKKQSTNKATNGTEAYKNMVCMIVLILARI